MAADARLVRRVLGAIAAGLILASAAGAQSPDDERRAFAVRTAEPIHLDGHLDEPAWSLASAIGELRQQDPVEGAEPTERTDVRVLYSASALYFGIVCYDRVPSEIVSTQLTRDADLEADDRIMLILDPFLDHRNGFFFEVNPSGARADGQISNNAQRLTRDWDGIWNAAVRRSSEGWTAEIEIPFKTLRFKPERTAWGLNVERHLKRRQETSRWTGARQNVWIGNLAVAGQLDGLTELHQGLGLDVRPYVSAGRVDGKAEPAAGLDTFKNVAPNLTAAVTVNTDFAETEADTRQVNLTRFPLFFPEKRAFFLEGAGLYDIAGLTNSNDIRPFFSRRIGLVETSAGDQLEVPVRVGAKVSGRQSDYNVGVLDVQTGSASNADLPGGFLDSQNLFAMRVSRNLFQQSWIGGIVTNGNPAGGGHNTLVGADARFATSTFQGNRNLALDLYVLSVDDAATKRSNAAGFRLDYPNDRWDLSLNWKQIGDTFQPALGFVPRTGIRKTDGGMAFQPRPERWGVRQFFFELRPSYITNLENRVENWRIFTAPFNLRTESGEHVEWNYIPEFEHLDEPFEIVEGVVIPPGSYQWTQFRTQINTATKRRWVLDATWRTGGFYAGTRRSIELGLTVKPSTHFGLQARFERNAIDLPEGSFETHLMMLRADCNFTPNVSWATLTQYDNESRVLGFQSRFRWILQPGNDVFFVIDRGWHRMDDGRYEPEFDRGSAKLQYTFRF